MFISSCEISLLVFEIQPFSFSFSDLNMLFRVDWGLKNVLGGFFKCDLYDIGMCLAIPGKVVEIDGDYVIVDYVSEQRRVKSLLDVDVGDYVIVGGKMILERVSEADALCTIKIFGQLK